MKVLKFGGTSVGTVNSILRVKKIVEAIDGDAIVVVSALGGLTDKLILTAQLAASGDSGYKMEWENIRNRHLDMINQTIENKKSSDLKEEISQLLDELKKIFDGLALINSLPEKILDHIVSFGENISSRIVASIVDKAHRLDSFQFIKTERWHGKNIADSKLTESLIKKSFSNLKGKVIVPGFISTDRDTGEITNLGRGGSDYTAALIAAALDAEILEIWTDVDGFMTADPRIIPEAKVIDHLSFAESMELCTFGAKVVYPPTIYPVFHKNIPIKILNTFNPSAPGTLITDSPEEGDMPVKGVSPLKNTSKITLKAQGSFENIDLGRRALNILSKNGIRLFPLDNDDSSSSFSFAVEMSELKYTMELLEEEFAPEISKGLLLAPESIGNLTILAVVGINIKNDIRLSARIKNTLERDLIKVEAIASLPSSVNLAFMVKNEEAQKGLKIIHNLMF